MKPHWLHGIVEKNRLFAASLLPTHQAPYGLGGAATASMPANQPPQIITQPAPIQQPQLMPGLQPWVMQGPTPGLGYIPHSAVPMITPAQGVPAPQYQPLYSVTSAEVCTATGHMLKCVIDTGAASTIVTSSACQRYFPTSILTACEELDLLGLGGGKITSRACVSLSLRFIDVHGRAVEVTANAQVVDVLGNYELLLGTSTLRPAGMDVKWAKNDSVAFDHLDIRGHQVRINVLRSGYMGPPPTSQVLRPLQSGATSIEASSAPKKKVLRRIKGERSKFSGRPCYEEI